MLKFKGERARTKQKVENRKQKSRQDHGPRTTRPKDQRTQTKSWNADMLKCWN